jgi:hypothetical protein
LSRVDRPRLAAHQAFSEEYGVIDDRHDREQVPVPDPVLGQVRRSLLGTPLRRM